MKKTQLFLTAAILFAAALSVLAQGVSGGIVVTAEAKNANPTLVFTGGLSDQALSAKILSDFRQKEFMHEGLRWFDIRRFYLPVARNSKNSLYRALEKEDPRKVLQIPTEAIQRGLAPNPR